MENKNLSLNNQNNNQDYSPPKTEFQQDNINIDSEILKKNTNKPKISMVSFLFNENNFINNTPNPDKNQTIVESNNKNKLPYLKIDIKNKFSVNTELNTKRINKILTSYKKKYSDQKSHIENLINKFLEFKFPKCASSFFLISKEISKNVEKNTKLDLEFIENKINFFYKIRYDLQYLKYIKLNKDTCINLGYILCFCYKNLSKYKIKDEKMMQSIINTIINSKINVLNDFYRYCIDNNLIPDRDKKTECWKKNNEKYPLIPEMIFLINVFSNVSTIEIDMNIQGNIMTEEEVQLFIITFFNLQYLFNQLDNIKINFINEKIQNILYGRYYDKLYVITNNNQYSIKKNFILNENIYEKKWDFDKNFVLQNYRNINQNKRKYHVVKKNKTITMFFNENKKSNNIDDNDIILIKTKEAKNEFINVEISNNNKKLNELNNINDFKKIDVKSEKKSNKSFIRKNSNSFCKNKKDALLYLLDDVETFAKESQFYNREKFETLINKHIYVFDIIFFAFISLENLEKMKNIEVVLNDCYHKEIINYLDKYYSLNNTIINNNFHILDFLNNNISIIENFFLEFNSLDPLTFEKFLVLLKNNENESLTKLKISFFSCDITYYQKSVFKNYYEYKNNFKILYENSAGDTNDKMLNELLTCFINNINILFNIIKK